jgi:hypothetical protein
MALVADNVHHGPARVWLGVTNPASALPPTWMGHTAGVPATGTEVGYTEGDTIFRKGKTTVDINAEQANGPIKVLWTGEIVEAEFLAMERTYNTLRAAFDNTGTVDDVTRMGFYGGGSQATLRSQTVFLSSPRPDFVGKYEISVIYKAVSVTGYEAPYRKSAASTYRVILRGIFDTTRVIGDQLYQHSIEK